MVPVSLILLAATALALFVYGYVVASILAIMSFYTFSWPGKKKASPVLSRAEDVAVEMLRRKDGSDVPSLSAFVDSISGSFDKAAASSFNGRALARAEVLKTYDAEKSKILRLCATYAHKSNSLDKVESLIEVAEVAWQFVVKNEAPPAKIRREDLRQIESFAKSSDILDLLRRIPENSSRHLDRFRSVVRRCRAWQESVLAALSKETPLRSGDLIAYTLENDRYIIGSLRPKLVQMFYQFLLGSDATHMSLAVREKDGSFSESHMWGVPSLYNRTRLTVGSYGNKFYRAKADLFVDKKFASAIEKAFGAKPGEWKQVVEKEMEVVSVAFLVSCFPF